MGFNWKDFFYFQKNDRNGILLLLILIIISGLFVIFSDLFIEKYHPENDEQLKEFDRFQKNLISVETTNSILVDDKEELNEIILKKDTERDINTRKLNLGESIDLNSATVNDLIRIPGIGNVYAQRITEYRNVLGGFIDTEQLKEIKGMTEKKYEAILPYINIKKQIRYLKVNKLSMEELIKHPYINSSQAHTLLQVRGEKGAIKSVEELNSIEGFSPRDIGRLSPYISFQ